MDKQKAKVDAFHRDISAMDAAQIQERTTIATNPATAALQATGSTDMFYEGEYPENWEALLAEARAAYPERGGKRRNNYKRRFRNKMHAIARQHRIRKRERIAKHENEMMRRHKLALERKAANWMGPVLYF